MTWQDIKDINWETVMVSVVIIGITIIAILQTRIKDKDEDQ